MRTVHALIALAFSFLAGFVDDASAQKAAICKYEGKDYSQGARVAGKECDGTGRWINYNDAAERGEGDRMSPDAANDAVERFEQGGAKCSTTVGNPGCQSEQQRDKKTEQR